MPTGAGRRQQRMQPRVGQALSDFPVHHVGTRGRGVPCRWTRTRWRRPLALALKKAPPFFLLYPTKPMRLLPAEHGQAELGIACGGRKRAAGRCWETYRGYQVRAPGPALRQRPPRSGEGREARPVPSLRGAPNGRGDEKVAPKVFVSPSVPVHGSLGRNVRKQCARRLPTTEQRADAWRWGVWLSAELKGRL